MPMDSCFLSILFSLLLFAGCGAPSVDNAGAVKGDGDNAASVAQQAAQGVDVPSFNADSAYNFVAAQVAFGPRVPNSEAHKACGDYLEAKLASYGATVVSQCADITAYNGDVLKARNIIAQFQPDKSERILLCAHWDTRPWADSDPDPSKRYTPIDGANDGGSGVGALLEIARQLSIEPTELGVDIILFDAEDYGRHADEWRDAVEGEETWALGSKYWAQNPHVKGYRARYGILLDIIGAPNSTFALEGYSMYFARAVVGKVWNCANRLGYSKYFKMFEGGVITDDHLHVNKTLGIPCIDIINCDVDSPNGFGEYHHTVNDNMDWIDANTLKAVGQTVLNVIYNEK